MQYAVLIRGIGPGNPNMKNEKLCAALESLGFTNVHAIISSGNLIFESKSRDSAKLESQIEKAFADKLGLTKNFVVIRSKDELEELIASNPFKGKEHGEKSYLLVTFFKDRNAVKGGFIASVIDTEDMRTPEFMSNLEKKYGKQITSRTWLTIGRIVKKFEKTQK